MINRLRKQDAVFLLAAVVVFAVLQFLMAERIVSSFWRLNISLICLNVMLASSLNLINGVTGQFSLGHAGFMAVGAYVSAVCTVFLHLPFIVSFIGGAAAAGLLAFSSACRRCGCRAIFSYRHAGHGGNYPHLHFEYTASRRRVGDVGHSAGYDLSLAVYLHDRDLVRLKEYRPL